MPRAAWSASARGGSRKKIGYNEKHTEQENCKKPFAHSNFLAPTGARQGAPGRPRHRRPPPFLPKGDCVPLGTLPEKRENADGEQTDKLKFTVKLNIYVLIM